MIILQSLNLVNKWCTQVWVEPMERSGKIMYSLVMTRPNVIDATLCHTFQSIETSTHC